MYDVKVGSLVKVQKVRMGDKKETEGRWQGCDAFEIPKQGKKPDKCWLHFWLHPIIEDLRDNDIIMVDEIVIKAKMRRLDDVSQVMQRPNGYWVPSPEFDIRAHKVESGGGGFTTDGFDTTYHPEGADDVSGELPFD